MWGRSGELELAVLVVFAIGALLASCVVGSLVGVAVGRRWHRPTRGALAGTAGALAAWGILGLLIGEFGLRATTGSKTFAVLLMLALAACSAWIAVSRAGDPRPMLTASDNWQPPDSEEIARIPEN
jgi:hypothetical protein